MDDLEALKAEVCRLLDNRNFWQAIQTIRNAMMENNYSPVKYDEEEATRKPGILE